MRRGDVELHWLALAVALTVALSASGTRPQAAALARMIGELSVPMTWEGMQLTLVCVQGEPVPAECR
jgi:hypothetical protein